MMTVPNYQSITSKLEKQFLQEMIARLDLNNKRITQLVFMQRFLSNNDDYDNSTLSGDLMKMLSIKTQESKTEDSETKKVEERGFIQDHLQIIYKNMEGAGCDFNGARRDKLPIAQAWLRETVFPQWFPQQLGKFWSDLTAGRQRTHRMGLLQYEPPSIPTFNFKTPAFASRYLQSVKLGAKVQIGIDWQTSGHLLLLSKGTSGDLYCLSPSAFAPNCHFSEVEQVILPTPESGDKYLELEGEPGTEELLAIISPKKPEFKWLEGQDFLQLEASHLLDLSRFLESPSHQVLYATYQVVA